MKHFLINYFVFLSLICASYCVIVLHRGEKIKMRDGVELAAKVYFSAEQILKKNPVLLVRTPYGTNYAKDTLENFVEEGFVAVVQDIRGMLDSKGTFSFFRASGDDNIDTMKWILSQNWSNGKIGTDGFSAPGITQYMSLYGNPYQVLGNPAFQVIGAATPDMQQFGVYQGGALRHSLSFGWLTAIKQQWYFDVLVENEAFTNSFWDPLTVNDSKRIHWPSIHIGGWYDIFQKGILDGWMLYSKNPEGNPQYLIMASGGHCVRSNIVFPNGQVFSGISHNFLTDLLNNKAPLEKIVNFYVINLALNGTTSELGNFWVSMDTFPQISESRYYLTENNQLVEKIPDESNITFSYDPKNPTPTNGGNNLMIPCGPRNQIENEKRSDNVVFTSEEFDKAFSLVGPIRVNLVVSSNRNDTDFVCRLSDVFPTGESLLLNDGIIRMKWIQDRSTPNLIIPNKKYEISVDLWSMAAIISPGHRLRVTCTSSNYPRFSVNGNSGQLLKDEKEEDYLVAENTIYFGANSYVSIPSVNFKVLEGHKY